ncbi:MAG TPA: hypothetical protein EYH45_03185 [Candidatus Caldiarchaeum subterraneum]|uniref:HhH-GPD domain-containing protein n=1 Tax=Caldiarchaeum subterraneum TaxID=311458 RepID=A0A832ZVD1_CALS0|nr:hypothetical protein [Aigarchaeota archaeon]HIQ29547.1 hypothetical protein [Candidatus Caldarchaeum subterraneum]
MALVPDVKAFCERCLKTERWNGKVILMVVDAVFTSVGLNYFTAVVPKVIEFEKRFVEPGEIADLRSLSNARLEKLREVWKNTRSWKAAKEAAQYLSTLGKDDKQALRSWALSSDLEGWRENPLGRIKGIGINTYQYLRMMGGVDTVMPDKIVKRVINNILREAGFREEWDDIRFVRKVEWMAAETGYRPIELCWMTWLIQREGKLIRMEKYSSLLNRI